MTVLCVIVHVKTFACPSWIDSASFNVLRSRAISAFDLYVLHRVTYAQQVLILLSFAVNLFVISSENNIITAADTLALVFRLFIDAKMNT